MINIENGNNKRVTVLLANSADSMSGKISALIKGKTGVSIDVQVGNYDQTGIALHDRYEPNAKNLLVFVATVSYDFDDLDARFKEEIRLLTSSKTKELLDRYDSNPTARGLVFGQFAPTRKEWLELQLEEWKKSQEFKTAFDAIYERIRKETGK